MYSTEEDILKEIHIILSVTLEQPGAFSGV